MIPCSQFVGDTPNSKGQFLFCQVRMNAIGDGDVK